MKFKLIFFVFIITFTISCFLINDRISNWLSSYQNINQYSNAKKLVVKSKEENINVLYKSSSTSSKTGIIKICKF
jgi:hypothetical protein